MHARVFVGTRHTSALCYLCVCSPCPPPWLFVCSNQRNQKGGCAVSAVVTVAPRLATWHDMVTYLRSWWRCVACLLFVCMRRHSFCPLSLPFASYISGRAGGRWARLGYASWSPFTFVGVVAVLVSCPLRSVAWHATYLCQALSLPQPPVLWSGQQGFRDPCVPGAVDAGVWTQHRPHSVRPCGPALLAVGVAEERPRGGCLPPLWGAPGVRRCPSPDRPSSGAGSQGSATRVSRVRSMRACGPSTGPTACALAGRRCSLWGWRKGVPGGGCLPPL